MVIARIQHMHCEVQLGGHAIPLPHKLISHQPQFFQETALLAIRLFAVLPRPLGPALRGEG
eukprot:CAMPEP_0173242102 /NCGR_PEP_ID=MMETSP1142-20121109/14762_1 /TAXON_ID=483371 /ORGANISM="non described non described, Strain CCMP2298" /LENGTH=60 /DNA_ID=CAMNT_0014173551 /DNA_START=614 /DNA_END=793 /DNA_ORIENTATION=+